MIHHSFEKEPLGMYLEDGRFNLDAAVRPFISLDGYLHLTFIIY